MAEWTHKGWFNGAHMPAESKLAGLTQLVVQPFKAVERID